MVDFGIMDQYLIFLPFLISRKSIFPSHIIDGWENMTCLGQYSAVRSNACHSGPKHLQAEAWLSMMCKPQTAITKYHRQGDTNNRNLFSHSSRGWTSKIKVPTHPAHWGEPLLFWLADSHLLALSSCDRERERDCTQALWCLFLQVC